MIYLVIIVIVILILEAIITWVKNNKTKPKILHEVDLLLIKIIESNNSVHELDYTWEELKIYSHISWIKILLEVGQIFCIPIIIMITELLL